jgi:Predicted membrane protein involved in D-alanine export
LLFNSGKYVIFLPIVVLLYYLFPVRVKKYWLLAASYYFYMCWNAKYALLIIASTFITYLSGLGLARVNEAACGQARRDRRKKWIVALSFVSNLGILFYFKYFNFALDLLQSALARIHIQLSVPAFDILLPVGISFYTFQALSYTMDVYREKIGAERDFFTYALFVSFFPQLVAGPIERSGNLLGQLKVAHRFEYDNLREGLLIILWGFFLKLVIADRLALYIDAVYGARWLYPGCYLALASILFPIQVYCDFYGYSTIAMGSAKLLGIELMENFRSPFLSATIADFWRNWHVSLTSWFKDYLYIPLGGSRKGKFRKQFNRMVVFLVSGLWHGANLTYVVWGGLNGVYQVVGELLMPLRLKLSKLLHIDRESLGVKLVQIPVTFLLFAFSMIFFRSSSVGEGLAVIGSILHVRNPWILIDGSLFLHEYDSAMVLPMTLFLGALLFSDICKQRGIAVRKIILRQDAWFRWLSFALATAVVLTFGVWGPGFSEANFIYFQF